MFPIKDKVIIITGVSSGVREAAARLLASRGAHCRAGGAANGAIEALVSAIEAAGGSAVYQDVTDLKQMEAIVALAREQYGRVDVLVNNAGVMPLSPLEALKIDEWNRMIDVNIRVVLHGIAAALPVMQAQGSGQIVSIASIGAYEVSPTAAVYCATKYAVRAITEGLRLEVGPGIRVTLVSPGVTESELADSISDAGAIALMKEYRRNAIPASTIAGAIAYAIEQPADVGVNELVVRPAAQRA